MTTERTGVVQIARIDEPIEELHYTGDEGFVVEVDGVWVASAPTLEEAKQAGHKGTQGTFVHDEAADYWGRETWTAQRLVATLTEINHETEDGSYDTIKVTDPGTGEEVLAISIPSSNEAEPYDRAIREAGITDYRWENRT